MGEMTVIHGEEPTKKKDHPTLQFLSALLSVCEGVKCFRLQQAAVFPAEPNQSIAKRGENIGLYQVTINTTSNEC